MASLANDKMQDDDSTTMVGGAAEFVSDDKSEINNHQPRAPSPIPTPVSPPLPVTPLEQQVANAKKAYQDADNADADNTMELYDYYQELKQKMLEQQDNQAGGDGSSGGAHWANNDKTEITEPVVVPPAPIVVPPTPVVVPPAPVVVPPTPVVVPPAPVVVPPTSPEPSPPPSPKITPKTTPTTGPPWDFPVGGGCPKGHMLTGKVWCDNCKSSCDNCKKKVPVKTCMSSCRICNFDLCADCLWITYVVSYK